MSYTLIGQSDAKGVQMVRRGDGVLIPSDSRNVDWQEYEGWLAAGNQPVPASAASPPGPAQVPMWAMQAALQIVGRYDAINQAVTGWAKSSDPNEVAAFFAWTMGNYASRDSAFIGTFATQFSLTAAEVDALFAQADKIAGAAG